MRAVWSNASIGGMRRSVVIVDDHAGFRARARARALLAAAGYEVVGEAGDGESGVRAARDLRPEVVLLDVQLPDISGFEVARRIDEDPEPPAIILISSRDAADYGGRIGRSGARGFIGKAELSGGALEAVLTGSGR
jgi:DNA-binding NarL/FixJ family response regulator